MDRITRAVGTQPTRADGKSLGRPLEGDGMLVHGLDYDSDMEDYSEDVAEVGGYGEGMADGLGGEEDTELEGEGLLWGDSTSNDEGSPSTPFASMSKGTLLPGSTIESNSLDAFDPDKASTRVVPPTPESSRNKRVSFSGSVRIARGIGSPSPIVKHPSIAPPNHVDFLSTSRPTSSAPPPSKTQSPNRSPSLSQSEFVGGSTGVPPSFFYSTSHLPRNSLSQLSLPHYFPTITRSSSPASSIYAPLSESRTTFTSPMDIRPPIRHRPPSRCVAPDCPRRQSKGSRSWINWFRVSEPQKNRESESQCCVTAAEGRITPDEELEEGGMGYHALVAYQRREHRRKNRRSISPGWSSQMGSEGMGGAEDGNGWVARVLRVGSYGTFVPTSRTTDSDIIDSSSPPLLPRANKPSTRRSKTAADVAFGSAPRRWWSWNWLVWKIKGMGTRLRERWGEWRGRRKEEGEREGEEEYMYRPIV